MWDFRHAWAMLLSSAWGQKKHLSLEPCEMFLRYSLANDDHYISQAYHFHCNLKTKHYLHCHPMNKSTWCIMFNLSLQMTWACHKLPPKKTQPKRNFSEARSSKSSAFGEVSMAIMKSFWNHCKLYLPQNKPNGLSETWLSDMSIIVRVHHDMNGKDGVTSQHMSSIQYKKVASSHKNKQLAHVEWTKTSHFGWGFDPQLETWRTCIYRCWVKAKMLYILLNHWKMIKHAVAFQNNCALHIDITYIYIYDIWCIK